MFLLTGALLGRGMGNFIPGEIMGILNKKKFVNGYELGNFHKEIY